MLSQITIDFAGSTTKLGGARHQTIHGVDGGVIASHEMRNRPVHEPLTFQHACPGKHRRLDNNAVMTAATRNLNLRRFDLRANSFSDRVRYRALKCGQVDRHKGLIREFQRSRKPILAHENVLNEPISMSRGKNVLGGPLEPCSYSPLTGFHRDGCCRTGPQDLGVHSVCVRVTEDFLAFSKANGNDLSTPKPAFEFPGLLPGDRWCLCASRWLEALQAGQAPPVILEATDEATLEYVQLEDLKTHAIPLQKPASMA